MQFPFLLIKTFFTSISKSWILCFNLSISSSSTRALLLKGNIKGKDVVGEVIVALLLVGLGRNGEGKVLLFNCHWDVVEEEQVDKVGGRQGDIVILLVGL